MVSDNVIYTYRRYPVVATLAILFVVSGYLLAVNQPAIAILCMITGLAMARLLLRYVDSTNRAVTHFFSALSNNDTAVQFPVVAGNKSLRGVYESMNSLNRHFQQIRLQHEYNEKYYRALIRHAATGLLVLEETGKVELVNKTACRYAGISEDSTNPDMLRIKNPGFFDVVQRVKPGEEVTYRQIEGNNIRYLSFRATVIKKGDVQVKMVSIQDIRSELEYREIDSYRKLISVLTHEIMNLMSPLTSVSKALFDMYHTHGIPAGPEAINESLLKSTINSVRVIDEQSDAIMRFLETYRRITRIPAPVFSAYEVDEWVEQLKIVYSARMKESGIHFTIRHDKTMKSILADKALINQVVVNLISNAIDAVMENEGERAITLQLMQKTDGGVAISLANNGPIIPAEIQDKIFVPFFTTRKDGSGIGLSICQEIVKLHKGSLTLISSPVSKTVFIIEI